MEINGRPEYSYILLSVYNRILNFKGADIAASRLRDASAFKRSRTVKVNPDSPQRLMRYYVLVDSKLLTVPNPRLKKDFSL